MLKDSRPLVIVLSRNYSTGLGIIRSLGMAGYPVDLIASTKKKGSSIIASSSKYVRNAVEVLSSEIQGDTGQNLIAELMKYVGREKKKIVLFPADDFTASVILGNYNLLKKHFYMPYTTREDKNCVDLMNKNFQGKLAHAIGLNTPFEWLISLKNEIVLPVEVTYPCFVKPCQSFSGHKTEMKVCQTEKELRKHLLKMKTIYSERDILVQEYLQIDKEYDLSGVCVDQKIIIPAVIEKTRIARYERGVTMTGKMIPLEELGGVGEQIKSMLREFHYVGMFDLELYLCGDKLYFNEVNLRSGGPNFSYFLNGVNLPDIFVKVILGETYEPKSTMMKTYGKSFVYEKVAWEDYINGYLTREELKECVKGADFKLLDNKDDPKPGSYFSHRIRLSMMKQRIKKKLHKSSTSPKMDMEKKTVVVCGRNYGNILAMTRDLGEAGYGVEVLRIFKNSRSSKNPLNRMKPEKYSKYVQHYEECFVDGNIASVIDVLLRLAGGERKLLLPTDDYTAYLTDLCLEQLKEYYIVPSVASEQGGIIRLMNKDEQKGVAEKFNLPVLHSELIRAENGQFDIPNTVTYPCFIKPNISMNSTKARMCKCESKEELQYQLEKYAMKEDFEILVEEFADIKEEYSILGLSTGKTVIAPGVFKTIEGGHRERKGVALTGEILKTERLQKIINECCSFIESLDYTGLFDVDLIETKDGKIFFVELNFRAGASMCAFTPCGVNLVAMYADNLVKKIPIDTRCKIVDSGKRFISEKILLEEFARKDVGFIKANRLIREADIYFINNYKDIKPYTYFRKYYLVALLMRPLYRLRDNNHSSE